MATEAQVIAIFYKIKLVICGVGVMAFYAAALQDDFMDAKRLLRYHRFMAFIADFICIFRQKFAVGGGMRVMAAGTLPGFYRGMHKPLLDNVPEIFVAAETLVPSRTGLQLEFVLRRVSCRI
jgi:hypothetical protein